MLLKIFFILKKYILFGIALICIAASLSCSVAGSIPFLSTKTPTPTITPTPTPTNTPTPTLTPTPITTGHLQGQLVEGILGQNTASSPRPPLSNVLILLCAEFNGNTCTTDPELATYTDENGAFTFVDLEPGRYVVLYNPYLIADGVDYLQHFTNRELDFTNVSTLVTSIIGGAGTLSITGGPKAGVKIVIKDGNMTLGLANADTAIITHSYNIVAEFVKDGTPATVQISLGQTTKLTLSVHAVLKIGDTTFKPAGTPIDLPNTHSGTLPPASEEPTDTPEL